MASKSVRVVVEEVTCIMCLAEIDRVEVGVSLIIEQLDDDQVPSVIVHVCWFCAQNVQEPLRISACLVPLISTGLILGDPENEDIHGGKKQ